MTSDNMKKAYAIIDCLSVEELTELSDAISTTLKEKRQKFKLLVETLEETLNEIFANYPNATVPLSVSPTETIDLMDYIVPHDFVERCKMGD